MRYQKVKSQSYGANRKFGVKAFMDKRFRRAVAIKPAGAWSRDLLESPAGKALAAAHLENVRKALEKAQPKNATQLKNAVKKAVMTPQQNLVILYEKSLLTPLSTKEFHEYMELFRDNFPEAYESLHGNKTPAQIVAECVKATKQKPR